MDTSNDETYNKNKMMNIDSGNKVLKNRIRNRPSLLNYYGESKLAETKNKKNSQNDQDIDETFDFLDEELNKYDD